MGITTSHTAKELAHTHWIATDFIDADGKPFTFEDLMGSNSIIEGDHKTARAKGNETSKANLVLRNKTANIRKSDKTIAGK